MATPRNIGLLHGPNLGRLGVREPEKYGTTTLAQLTANLQAEAAALNFALHGYQSNHEGALIDTIEAWTDANFSGVIINPGAFAHTSIALRDAIAGTPLPFIEVHITNVHAREPFRQTLYSAEVCAHMLCGQGLAGYSQALQWLAENVQ